MKKSFKGFTLIECIVALAILGIASLTMAQIYASVSSRNKMNHLVNTSLANQVAYAEKYTKDTADTITVKYNNGTAVSSSETSKPAHKRTTVSNYNNYVEIVNKTPASASKPEEYSFPVDIYVLKSRDRNGDPLTAAGDAGYKEADYNLRYKYLQGNK